jgi:hypothetical protein
MLKKIREEKTFTDGIKTDIKEALKVVKNKQEDQSELEE